MEKIYFIGQYEEEGEDGKGRRDNFIVGRVSKLGTPLDEGTFNLSWENLEGYLLAIRNEVPSMTYFRNWGGPKSPDPGMFKGSCPTNIRPLTSKQLELMLEENGILLE